MLFLSRLIAALAYAGAAFLFGVSLGERGELGPVQYVFAGVIPLTTFVLALVAKRGRANIVFTGLVMLGGLALGQYQYRRAWSDCVARADFVRTALVDFQRRTGDYPARLENLGTPLPCRCGFRRTILHYMSNERGFRLWFTNDRETVVFTATGKSSIRRRT